jgi:hypothetical protein
VFSITKRHLNFAFKCLIFRIFLDLLGDLIETILTLHQITGLVPGREADRTCGYLVEVTDSPVIVIQVAACDSENHTVEFTPALRTVCLNKVQENGTHSLVLTHFLNF